MFLINNVDVKSRLKHIWSTFLALIEFTSNATARERSRYSVHMKGMYFINICWILFVMLGDLPLTFLGCFACCFSILDVCRLYLLAFLFPLEVHNHYDTTFLVMDCSSNNTVEFCMYLGKYCGYKSGFCVFMKGMHFLTINCIIFVMLGDLPTFLGCSASLNFECLQVIFATTTVVT